MTIRFSKAYRQSLEQTRVEIERAMERCEERLREQQANGRRPSLLSLLDLDAWSDDPQAALDAAEVARTDFVTAEPKYKGDFSDFQSTPTAKYTGTFAASTVSPQTAKPALAGLTREWPTPGTPGASLASARMQEWWGE